MDSQIIPWDPFFIHSNGTFGSGVHGMPGSPFLVVYGHVVMPVNIYDMPMGRPLSKNR